MDPLATMQLAARDYRYFGEVLRAAAGRHCAGRLVAVHEGGYSEMYGECLAAVVLWPPITPGTRARAHTHKHTHAPKV